MSKYVVEGPNPYLVLWLVSMVAACVGAFGGYYIGQGHCARACLEQCVDAIAKRGAFHAFEFKP